MAKKIDYHRMVEDQKKWIEDHGGDVAGYIRRYGDPGITCEDGRPMCGAGGTLIYEADIELLHRFEGLAGHPHYNVPRK